MLKAYHSGGSVVVEISDDGRGLDRDKIIEKAIARGLIQSGKSVSDSEIVNLIFQPGFSRRTRQRTFQGGAWDWMWSERPSKSSGAGSTFHRSREEDALSPFACR